MAAFRGSSMSAIWSQGRVAPSTSLDTDARSDTRKKRDSHKRNTKRRLVDLLVEGGFAEVAGKVAACNSNYFALACRNGHLAQILPAFRCRNRLCPYCAAERQRRAYTKLLPIVENFARAQTRARAVLITLTIRSSFDPLRAQDHDFKTALRRFRRMKRWKGRIRGAVCGYESLARVG